MSEIILKTSEEAAKFVTIEGWVDRNGRYWGKDEYMARWSGCTHIICPECGTATPKGYTICSECREKKAIKRYEAKERKQWDGERPLYSEAADQFFFDDDELMDFMEDSPGFQHDIDALRLVICEPIYLRQLDFDHWCDQLDEDVELSEAVMDAIDNLNAVIRDEGPVSWQPGKFTATIWDTKTTKNEISH